jgi:hypothetical protein
MILYTPSVGYHRVNKKCTGYIKVVQVGRSASAGQFDRVRILTGQGGRPIGTRQEQFHTNRRCIRIEEISQSTLHFTKYIYT